jgi:glycosyltransferase involved in cell wall biosynthesis
VNDPHPLVTIGVPVRNGAATLALALASVERQTYQNFEVIVSDNASDDETDAVVASFVDRDRRFRYVRQATPIKMLENFRAVVDMAAGKYVMWLPHDDLFSDDLIERLVEGLETRPDAVLAFGDVELFTDYDSFSDVQRLHLRYATRGMPVWRRLLRSRNSGWEVKGMFRRTALEGFAWWEHPVSPDWPLLTHFLVVGEVIDVPGAVLMVGYDPNLKTTSDRAARQSYSTIGRLPMVTVSWRSALAARDAARQVGRRRHPLVDFWLVLLAMLWEERRSLSPFALSAWRSRVHRLFARSAS